MEENIKDEEFKRVIKEVNDNLENKLVCGRRLLDELFVILHDDIKYAEFQGEFGKGARSIKELKPLFDYLNKNGYKTNLD